MSVLPVHRNSVTGTCNSAMRHPVTCLHYYVSSLSDKFRQKAEANNDQHSCTERKRGIGPTIAVHQCSASFRQVQHQLMIIMLGTPSQDNFKFGYQWYYKVL